MDTPFMPQSTISINGDCYCIKLMTDIPDGDGGYLFKYMSIDMATGDEMPGFTYLGPWDL